MTQEKLERTFQVPSPARLTLSNLRGSVDIQSGEDGVIIIKAIKHLDSGDAERTEIEMDQDADGSLTVKTQYQEKTSWLFRSARPCKVDYIIQVPQNCSLSVAGVSNSTAASGVSGLVSIKSVSGYIKLSHIEGNLKSKTVSGSLAGENLSGAIQVDSVSGSVKILESNLESFTSSTISGNVYLQTILGIGPYRFKSISGNVKIKLPKGTNYSIQSRSVSGRVKGLKGNNGDLPQGSKRVIQGGNGVAIHHNSISGDLSIDSGFTSTTEEVTESSPHQNPVTKRQEILDRIAAGEISVDEALESLKRA